MGSQQFTVHSRGKSAKEAYDYAVDDANYEYGHQEGYSGAINATPGFSDATSKYKNSKLPLYNFIEQRLEKMTKFDGAECICVEEPKGNTNKIKTQVEHIVTPGTKKWVLMYVVYCLESRITSAPTKTEAVKLARQYSEKNQCTTTIKMERTLQKREHALVAKISYKKSPNEKEGKYVFYGWASC